MTVTRVGRAERYRSGGGFERFARSIGRRIPTPLLSAVRRGYEAALDRCAGSRLTATLPGGERIRLSARHRHLSWNPEEYAAFRSSVRPGHVVIDAGANAGAYTLLFAQWVGAGGRVFAFEPAPHVRASLERHLRLNGLADRVEVVPAAVAALDGFASFTIDGHGGASSLYTVLTGIAAIQVPTVSLDAFCALHRVQPDVIKVDVEGAELDALRGARRVIAAAPVDLFVEFHPAAWAARGIGRADLERELAAQRLTAEPLDPAFDVWSTEGICARLRQR